MADFEKPASAVVIAATFTAEPLLPYLRLVFQEAGLAFDIRFAAYNQVFQELLSPHSPFALNANGIDVALLRLEDFVREIKDPDEAITIVRRTVDELAAALAGHTRRVKIPTVMGLMPPSPGLAKALLSEIARLNDALIGRLKSSPGISLLSFDDCERGSAPACYNALTDQLAHIPFSEEQYASIALAVARKVHALRVPAHKVLVLDCDETLWRGVIGEDGVAGLVITPGNACLQRFATEKQAQGTLICLVSKNIERDVLDVFEQRSDMILKPEHIVAHRINWESKPYNIASLARTLNLGLDAFVFIDDNPIECAQMRAELPQVVTLQVPPENEIESFLEHLWTFDKVAFTDEDTRRTAMYRENAAREELAKSATDIAEFIASLDLVIEIAPPLENEWARTAQLTQRTNQFNFTAARYTEAEIRALAAGGNRMLCVKVRDRFGDYGLVGVVIANELSGRLAIDTFLLSCRVLGRGVEHAIVRHLGTIAKQQNLRQVEFTYIATVKNEPARVFLESVAAKFSIKTLDRFVYEIPAEIASDLAYQPSQRPALANEPDQADANASTNPPPSAPRWERYDKLARVLVSGGALADAVRRGGGRRRALPNSPTMPSNEMERELLSLWRELFQIDHLGVEDDYFALGGTSLLVVRLIAEISRRFGTTLPMTIILEAPTVRALARHLEHPSTPRTENLVELKRGGPRNLFLVHDGDGETLLYLNLANRMPEDIAVFGILPRGITRVPLAHATIEEMAAFYVALIREKQPDGPYLLGGMCAGGVIAYEMGLQLVQAGQPVDLVALLDSAKPGAAKKPGRVRKERLGRLRQAIADGPRDSPLKRAGLVIRTFSQKSFNVLRWEIAHRCQRFSTRVRFRLLSELLRRDLPWPRFVPCLNVRQIYDSAEIHYTPGPLSSPFVVLARGTRGWANDTPYQEIYADQGLGWDAVAHGLAIVDVEGGHSSMLQEPFVDSLAAALMPYLEPSAEPVRARR